MKGFVELNEAESREVKGGTVDLFFSLINGAISLITNIFPTLRSVFTGIFD
ncbi:MAG: hypothetical protein LBC41_01085 [Clostridiales bacterium]|nr:hypothetical protein [Clostridiales bacterium]MDR2749228.1 hypothetical protein [Clostridiales bacterium]